MSRDPDLHHAISMRPTPFNIASSSDRERSSDPDRGYQQSPIDVLPVLPLPESSTTAATTSYEFAGGDSKRPADPISRSVYSNGESSTHGGTDLEACQTRQTHNIVTDPYHLADSLKTPEQISTLRANISRKRAGKARLTTPFQKRGDFHKGNKLRKFYEAQNENINRMLKPVDEHRRQAREEHGAEHLKFKIAVNGSFAANICLAGLQLYGAISSGSLSLFTTMADAIFDPLSNVCLILCNRAVNRVDPRRFPSGKARIETSGNIVFCFLMTSVSFILIVQSAVQLAEGSEQETSNFHLPAIIAVAIAFVTKFCLFLYCWALRNKYSHIRILWEDHRNDLFINGFGLLTSVGGSRLRWWIDPMGAIILSCLIAFLWLRTAYSEFQLLIGVSADTNMLQLITYISMTHDDSIKGLDTVRAYYSGPRVIVEVDIVMDERRTLKETHDIAEGLQTKLESLPDVERCFVHVDYETDHAPEHFTKKEL